MQSSKNKYSLFPTADGSFSYHNASYDEAYHSEHGAYAEALHKHVIASRILELRQPEIRILDVCFGLGYNSGVAIEKILEQNPETQTKIIGLENDPEILKLITELEIPESLNSYQAAHKMLCDVIASPQSGRSNPQTLRDGLLPASPSARYRNDEGKTRNDVEIQILIGDAREQIKNLESNYFDAVFFDPFSPRKCPELWDLSFITEVVRCTKPGAYISTYSSSRIAKDGFSSAGCSLEEGPKLGRRNGGVLARKLC